MKLLTVERVGRGIPSVWWSPYDQTLHESGLGVIKLAVRRARAEMNWV